MAHFMVVEESQIGSLNNHNYRNFRGATYHEEDLRKWLNETWQVPLDASLEEAVEAAREGGWIIFQLVSSKD